MNKQLNQILNSQEILIYGAGMMGKSLLNVLSSLVYDKNIKAFIVKDKMNNPNYIEGIPVIGIEDAIDYKNELILVALHEKYLNDAMRDLQNHGFINLIIVSFDNDLWCDIREKWIVKSVGMPYGIEYLQVKYENSFHIYIVHSEFDKELAEKIEDKPYEISIQVGTSLTDNKLFEICDNVGDNISDKNKQYCELTALYWAWKNDKSDYIGLSHYRRKFVLSEGEIFSILSDDIDMVVTVPVMNLETVKGQYIKDHSEFDWNIMEESIRVLSPEYKDALEIVSASTFYFAYNMFIAKREVLNNYCEWLFNILKYCEDKIGNKNDKYQNRYIGFLAERLLTIYIAKHTELNVRVVHKHFIETKVN